MPYMPTERRVDYISMGAEICKLFNAFCKEYGRELKLVFEPGKYIVAEAGYLLTQVCCIKKNRERIIVGCDSGFPQLIRPVLYGAYHHITNLSNPDGPMKVYDICGNICETGDRFAEQRKVQEIHEGDILMIANAGAYCYSMGGVYNMRPMPAESSFRKGSLNSPENGYPLRNSSISSLTKALSRRIDYGIFQTFGRRCRYVRQYGPIRPRRRRRRQNYMPDQKTNATARSRRPSRLHL